MRGALAIAGVLLAGATAHAQPADGEHEEKHASTAVALALGGTAAGVGMFFLGAHTDRPELIAGGALTALAAPSFGRWYAGEYSTGGLYLRLGGAGLALTALVMMMQNKWPDADLGDTATALAITGGTLFAGGAIYDIATAPKAVERSNRKHAISISPGVVSSGGGPAGFGLQIGGSF